MTDAVGELGPENGLMSAENRMDIKINFAGVEFCVRDRCERVSADGSGFCAPCRDWVAGRSDADPMAAEETR